MKRLIALVGAVLMSIAVLVLAAPRALADDDDTPSSWNIARYDVTTDVAANGTTKVTVDMDFDFSSDPGHGPFVTLVTKMRVPDDPDKWRVINVKLDSVTSGTGANTATQITKQNEGQVIRIGSEGRTYTGKQNYKIVYTATGIVNPNAPGSNLDEFNWNVIFADQVPINNLTVTVNGPASTSKTACFEGRSMTVACEASAAGSRTSTFHVDRLTKGQGMQVVAGYPAGTFPGVEPIYTKRVHLGNMFPTEPAPLVGGGLAAVLGTALVGSMVARRGRDQSYIGLAPGMVPVAGGDDRVGFAGRREIPVQFTPPRGIRPGEIGVLIDEWADNRDVTAGILDLAVRGHLQIQPDPQNPKNFTLARAANPPDEKLHGYEKQLLGRLFGSQMEVTNHDLADKANSSILSLGKPELEQRTVKLGWFKRKPSVTRAVALLTGALIVLLGVGLAFALGQVGWGWVGLGIAVAGVVLVALHGRMPARTAEGSAALAQAIGFRTYLSTAEADQIKFEEGIDVFSRYLPYATVFGVADRWVKVFQDLEARGIYHPDTTWYGGGYFWGSHYAFSQSVNAMTGAMTSSLQSAVTAANASSGSGGGSGFSGGGGVGGGSAGGW